MDNFYAEQQGCFCIERKDNRIITYVVNTTQVSIDTTYFSLFTKLCAAYEYSLPLWAEFEMGTRSVFWETSNARPPASV